MKKILDLLIEKGFVEGKDFTISEKVITILDQKRMIPNPEQPVEGQSDYQAEIEEIFKAPIPELEVLCLECLRTIDVQLIINDYLATHSDLKSPDDSLNLDLFLAGGAGWRFAHIPKPSFELLYDMADGSLENARQEVINSEVKAYLDSTDWMITRFIETDVPVPEEVTLTRSTMRLRHKKIKK